MGNDVKVTRKTLDAAGAETAVTDDIVKYVYTVELQKRIVGQSSDKMSIAKVKTKANIVLNMPDSGIGGCQKSGPPLSGNFILSCTDPVSKTIIETAEMAWNLHVIWIQEAITASIPFLADKIEVIHGYKYPYNENGREFFINFRDIHLNPAQCTLKSGTTTPLEGAKDA